MKKNIIIIMVMLFLSVFFGLYMGNGLQAATAKWTLMVYLDGDNNLEGAGVDDFLEMASVGSNSDINIVVQFDRIGGYDTRYDNWTSAKRFYVTKDMTPAAANALSDLGEINMGDPATLVSFVNWAKSNYPAEKYAVVLWNHGGGWRKSKAALLRETQLVKKNKLIFKAVCWDDTNGGDCLYTAEVKSAMNSTGGANLIGFDACLMGMVEVAYELRNYGEVMIGSEETEPYAGWPYNTILADLKTTPSWTASQLGTAIVDRYYESYGSDETQAAFDLSKLGTLASTISTFAQAMIEYWDTNQAAVKSAANNVMTQIGAAVIREKHGSSWSGAHGLAIYFPSTSGSFDSSYNGTIIDFPANTQWEEFLQEFYTSMTGSWISEKRSAAQQFTYAEHIDLYHFCELINVTPGNYYSQSLISNIYLNAGTAQNFHDDDSYITVNLPFNFTFFGETIPAGSPIYISSNGYVDFTGSSDHSDYDNTTSELAGAKRIAPLWADLNTSDSASGCDVYITGNPRYMTIRWKAKVYGNDTFANVELVLFPEGNIQFNYGSGNENINPWGTPPTLGISKGDGVNYYLSGRNGQTTFTNVSSEKFSALPTVRTITITSPNSGETLQIGSLRSITWNSENLNGKLKITLWKNGKLVGTIAPKVASTPGSFSWKVGTFDDGVVTRPGSAYRIKIKLLGTSVSDATDKVFTLIE